MHTNTTVAIKPNFMSSLSLCTVFFNMNILLSLLKYKICIIKIQKGSFCIFLVSNAILVTIIPCESCPRRHPRKNCSCISDCITLCLVTSYEYSCGTINHFAFEQTIGSALISNRLRKIFAVLF